MWNPPFADHFPREKHRISMVSTLPGFWVATWSRHWLGPESNRWDSKRDDWDWWIHIGSHMISIGAIWLVVWKMIFMTVHSVGNVITPTDELHHFSEGWVYHQPDYNIFAHDCMFCFQLLQYVFLVSPLCGSGAWTHDLVISDQKCRHTFDFFGSSTSTTLKSCACTCFGMFRVKTILMSSAQGMR